MKTVTETSPFPTISPIIKRIRVKRRDDRSAITIPPSFFTFGIANPNIAPVTKSAIIDAIGTSDAGSLNEKRIKANASDKTVNIIPDASVPRSNTVKLLMFSFRLCLVMFLSFREKFRA